MIAIVGAGLTGLALGFELRRRGADFVVLEAEDRAGGVIRSEHLDGHLLEFGPQRARLTASLAELVQELGVEDELVTAPHGLPLYVYARGKMRPVPFSIGDLLRTDLLSASGKLRLLLEPVTGAARPTDSVADTLVRKFGHEAYENLLGPLYGGLYASDPARMRVGLSLERTLREAGIGRSVLLPLIRRGGSIDPPPAVTFRYGLQTLTDALLRRLEPCVRLSTPVRRIEREGSGFRLHLERGEIDAARVVLTAPARASAELLREIDPGAAARIARLRYNPLAVVHLHSSAGLRGLGFQTALSESLVTRGVTFNEALFGRTGVYTAFLGGAANPGLVREADAAVADAAVEEFRRVTGSAARPLSVGRQAMPAWDLSWEEIRDLRAPPGVHFAASWESRPGMPGRLAQARRLAGELARIPTS